MNREIVTNEIQMLCQWTLKQKEKLQKFHKEM